jgi:superfamily II DNA or RNA helicase
MEELYYNKFSLCMNEYLKEYDELPGFKYVIKTTGEKCNNIEITNLQKSVYNKIHYEITHNVERKVKEEREYQTRYLDAIKETLIIQEHDRCLVKAPTGAGKTYMAFASLANMISSSTEQSTILMFVSPLLKINEQCIDETNIAILTNPAFTNNRKPFVGYQINCKNNNKEQIIQSLWDNENIILSSTYDSYQKAFEYISEYNKETECNRKIKCCIFDECHTIKDEFHKLNYDTSSKDSNNTKSKWSDIFNSELITKRLFLTATPNKWQCENVDGYKPYMSLYGNIIEKTSIAELIKLGYLAPINTYRAIISDNYENVLDTLPRPDTVESILMMATKYERKRICVFVNRRANAESLITTFNEKGYRDKYKLKFTLYFDKLNCDATYYDSNDINDFYKSDEKERANDDPELNEIRIIFSCKKMCMGVDTPPINCVVFADPRMNYGEMKQCIGRGLRKFILPDNSMKSCAILLFTTQKRDFDNMMISFLKFAKDELEYEILPDNTSSLSFIRKKKRAQKTQKHISGPKPMFNQGEIYDGVKVIDVELFERFCCGEMSEFQKLKLDYSIIKKHIIENNITTTGDYLKYAKTHNLVEEPNEYFNKYNIWKGWFNLFDIDTSEWFSTKEEWKSYCLSNNITSDNYYECLSVHTKLPTEPDIFYSNFTNICNELKSLRSKVRKKIRVYT